MKSYFKNLGNCIAGTAIVLSLYGLMMQGCEIMAALMDKSGSTMCISMMTSCILVSAVLTAVERKRTNGKPDKLDMAINFWKDHEEEIKGLPDTPEKYALLDMYAVTIKVMENERKRNRRRNREN